MEEKTCGVLALHKLLGKKWTYGLLHNIDTPITFNDLSGLTKNQINPTLLSERLKELVAFKLVTREDKGGRIWYTITKKGKKLKAILHEIKELSSELGCFIPEECEGKDCSGCQSFNKE